MKRILILLVLLLVSVLAYGQGLNANESTPFLGGIIIVGIFLIGYVFIRWSEIQKEKRKIDPITSGPASVEGGVKEEMIHSYFKRILGDRFPDKSIKIEVFRGVMSYNSIVEYSTGRKLINLDRVPAYEARIKLNGEYINPICVIRDNGVVVTQGQCIGFHSLDKVLEDGTIVSNY